MGKNDASTKVLAVVGTVLVALPLIAPLLMGLVTLGGPGGFRVDYLMPFEVYPVTLVGMALLAWAAFRARLRRWPIVACAAVMIGGVVFGALAATLTGIADSVETLEVWRYVLTAGLGVVSLLGQAVMVVEGVLLGRDLLARTSGSSPPLAPGLEV